jgi:acetyltransferase-like isoleucine patch superfamily enzyme
VTIGRGSIVGDEAVIADNIPPFSVVVGTPAKVIAGCLKDG